MARRSRARKPRAEMAHELDYTWEVDGEVLRASDGWVEWGGELILSMGETSGGAPYGLSIKEYQAIQVRETVRKKRMEERRKRTWEHLTVDLGRFICIHPIEAQEGIEIRADFVEDLPLGKPRTALAQALSRRHPFRAYRDSLQAHPQIREVWVKYHNDRIRSLAIAWVKEELQGASIRTT